LKDRGHAERKRRIWNEGALHFTNFPPCLSPQALDWIQETGEYYLSTHTSPGESGERNQELLKEYEEFRVSAKVWSWCREADIVCFPNGTLFPM
jgi:hypothetical protein